MLAVKKKKKNTPKLKIQNYLQKENISFRRYIYIYGNQDCTLLTEG